MLLVLTAGLGKYDYRWVEPVGVALELLDLGIRKHFGPDRCQNIDLITADQYYARALSLVAELNETMVVRYLSEGLMGVSEGNISYPQSERLKPGNLADYYRGLQKRCGLYGAASQIGVHLAGLNGPASSVLKEYGKRFGLACEARYEMRVPPLEIKELIKSAHEALINLPVLGSDKWIVEVSDVMAFPE